MDKPKSRNKLGNLGNLSGLTWRAAKIQSILDFLGFFMFCEKNPKKYIFLFLEIWRPVETHRICQEVQKSVFCPYLVKYMAQLNFFPNFY
jgi:hypothetical protein